MIVKLKEFRQLKQLTQQQAAESIGIDQRQWSRYEQGANEIPTRYVIEICKKHNISADWLLGLTEKHP